MPNWKYLAGAVSDPGIIELAYIRENNSTTPCWAFSFSKPHKHIFWNEKNKTWGIPLAVLALCDLGLLELGRDLPGLDGRAEAGTPGDGHSDGQRRLPSLLEGSPPRCPGSRKKHSKQIRKSYKTFLKKCYEPCSLNCLRWIQCHKPDMPKSQQSNTKPAEKLDISRQNQHKTPTIIYGRPFHLSPQKDMFHVPFTNPFGGLLTFNITFGGKSLPSLGEVYEGDMVGTLSSLNNPREIPRKPCCLWTTLRHPLEITFENRCLKENL